MATDPEDGVDPEQFDEQAPWTGAVSAVDKLPG
jgi:hypothetical protein